MEERPYYLINLETGKLNIFSKKEAFESLSAEQRETIRRYCLWSRPQSCWISKAKSENATYLRGCLDRMGFVFKETIGERLSFEQQLERSKERAEAKAERAATKAEKSELKSKEIYRQAKNMAGQIPFGQPILVGHHSEKRDRSFRDKIHNKFGKAFEEMDKAKYYQEQAELASKEAEGKKFKDPFYLSSRIKECERDLKVCRNRLQGKFYDHSPVSQLTDSDKIFFEERLKQIQEKLDFYRECMRKIPGQMKEDQKSGPEKTLKRKGRSL